MSDTTVEEEVHYLEVAGSRLVEVSTSDQARVVEVLSLAGTVEVTQPGIDPVLIEDQGQVECSGVFALTVSGSAVGEVVVD